MLSPPRQLRLYTDRNGWGERAGVTVLRPLTMASGSDAWLARLDHPVEDEAVGLVQDLVLVRRALDSPWDPVGAASGSCSMNVCVLRPETDLAKPVEGCSLDFLAPGSLFIVPHEQS